MIPRGRPCVDHVSDAIAPSRPRVGMSRRRVLASVTASATLVVVLLARAAPFVVDATGETTRRARDDDVHVQVPVVGASRVAFDAARARATLRALAGTRDDVAFAERALASRDASSRTPRWRRMATATDGDADAATTRLPSFYVLGAWQCGSEELGGRLVRTLGEDVARVRSPHFWNERGMTLERYAATWRATGDADGRGEASGDASPGYLAMTWSESTRFHVGFAEDVERCWRACQEMSADYDDGTRRSEAEDDARRRTARASPRRRCIDGVEGNERALGCAGESSAKDPPEELGGHGLALPHLMRVVYGEDVAPTLKFIVIVREPGARLRSAFYNYEHYKKRYGENESGFATYTREMMRAFSACAERHPLKGCARRFEAYDPKFEAVFFHADALIKSMYAVFLETWFEVFPREAFLILRGEDLWSADKATSVAAMKRVLEHLKLDASDETAETMAKLEPTHDLIAFKNESARPAMAPDVRAELNAFFAPHNARLAELLGDDRFRYA